MITSFLIGRLCVLIWNYPPSFVFGSIICWGFHILQAVHIIPANLCLAVEDLHAYLSKLFEALIFTISAGGLFAITNYFLDLHIFRVDSFLPDRKGSITHHLNTDVF